MCYTLYINDLPNVYPTSKISVYMDGMVFYFSGSGCKEVTIVLQDDLNRLVLNQSKTKGMLFGTKSKLESAEYFTIQSQGRNIEKLLLGGYVNR